jgi:subtilisin family serine protease
VAASAWLLANVSFLAAAETDPVKAWSEPIEVRLVAASRSIMLAPDVDPAEWAAAAGLEQFRVFRRGQSGSIVETTMYEQQWQETSARICDGPGVQSCEASQCQSIQLSGTVTTIGALPDERTTVRLLRTPPSLGEFFARERVASAAQCAVDSPSDSTLDDAAVDVSDAATAEPAVNFENGVLSIPVDEMPSDPERWTLAVATGCSVIKTPLAAVVPAMDPTRVVALVDASMSNAVAATHGLQVLRERRLVALQESMVLFEVPAQGSVAATVALLLADPRVRSVQPDYLYRTSAAYSDPYAFLNYGPEKTGAVRLHDDTTGGGLLVAVIDTGIDLEHPELVGRITEHRDLTEFGWSADAHGTAVAGVIAAEAGNEFGSYGVAPGVRLLALKACQPTAPGALEARCWTSTLAQALDAAIAADARIINLSLGGPPDPLVARYATLASTQNRVLVAAAGNDGPAAKPAFPAALAEVIAVTATDARDHLYRDATMGEFVDVAAPGVDIVAPGLAGSYPALSGTSLASAHFSGVVALLADLTPLMSAAELRGTLEGSARDMGAPGDDPQYGAGVVDACAAAALATSEAVVCRATAMSVAGDRDESEGDSHQGEGGPP